MALARKIGGQLEGGECIELVSDVGGGKTTFVRGLADGAGSGDHVSSPTFTVSKVYKTKSFDIVHFDFYRLQDADLIAYEVEEAVLDPKTVIVVEWSEIIKHVLPEARLVVSISALSENKRSIRISCDGKLDYLLEGLAK